MSDTQRLWLMVLWALWVMAWGGSFLTLWFVEPLGDGFARGLNLFSTFLGWQGLAGILAFGVFGFGRQWPERSGTRRASAVPLLLAILLALLILGALVWGAYL